MTDRELEVFTVLARGQTNQAIANDLSISERTVRAHLTSILEKLGLDSRMHACLASYVYVHERAEAEAEPVASDNSGRFGALGG